jgi:hypothetical protein
LRKDAVTKMSGVDARGCFSIHVAKLQCLRFVETRKAKANHCTTIRKTCFMVDVCRMFSLDGGTGDFQDAFIQICHLDVWHTIRRGAVPAIADSFGEVSILFTFKRVMKDQCAFFAKPSGVGLCGGNKADGEYVNAKKGGFHGQGFSGTNGKVYSKLLCDLEKIFARAIWILFIADTLLLCGKSECSRGWVLPQRGNGVQRQSFGSLLHYLHTDDISLKLPIRDVSRHGHFVVVAEAKVFFGL